MSKLVEILIFQIYGNIIVMSGNMDKKKYRNRNSFLIGKNTNLHPIFVLLFSIAPYCFFSTYLHPELYNFDHFAPSV